MNTGFWWEKTEQVRGPNGTWVDVTRHGWTFVDPLFHDNLRLLSFRLTLFAVLWILGWGMVVGSHRAWFWVRDGFDADRRQA